MQACGQSTASTKGIPQVPVLALIHSRFRQQLQHADHHGELHELVRHLRSPTDICQKMQWRLRQKARAIHAVQQNGNPCRG